MSGKEVCGIVFGGIERINTRTNASPNACEEIINLRPTGGTWRNIGRKKLLKSLNVRKRLKDYSVIVHPVSQEQYSILWNKKENSVSLYKSNGNVAETWEFSDTIISISHLENILTICTETEKVFYLWQESEKKYTRLNLEDCRPTIETRGINIANNNGHDFDTNEEQEGFHKGFDGMAQTDEITGYKDNVCHKLWLERIVDRIKAGFEKDHETDLPTIKNRFRGFSLYRVALELFDNTFINYSNIDFADTIRNYGDCIRVKMKQRTEQSNSEYYVVDWMTLPHVYGKHGITVNFTNLGEVKRLMEAGVIKNISIFMTIPRFCYDLDDYKHYKTDIRIGRPLQYSTWHYILPPIDKGIYNEFESGAFFRVKKYEKEDIDTLTDAQISQGRLSYIVDNDDVEKLSSDKPLPTPNIAEMHAMMFRKTYTYNSKQHLYDLRYNVFKGFTSWCNNYWDNPNLLQTLQTQEPGLTELRLFYTLSSEYNRKTFRITNKFSKDYIRYNEDGTTEIVFPKNELAMCLQYPSLEKIKIKIFVKVGEKELVLYERYHEKPLLTGQALLIPTTLHAKEDRYFDCNEALLTAYPQTSIQHVLGHDVPIYPLISTFTGTDDSIVKEIKEDISARLSAPVLTDAKEDINIIESTNILQLTETSNPLKLPATGNYSFEESDNRIVAVCSNNYAQSTTDRNFGLYPIYIFCTDGIYAMQVGSGDIDYATQAKINTDRVADMEVISTPSGIVYLTNAGLMVLSGKGLGNISEIMRGKPTMTSEENLNVIARKIDNLLPYNRALSLCLDVTKLSPFTDFFTEIAGAQPYYYPRENELCFCLDNYSYVYNFMYKCWYKRADTYQVEGNVLSKAERIENRERPNLSVTKVHIYGTEEEYTKDADICKEVAIISKPQLLKVRAGWGRQTPTRQYKHLERIIFNLQYDTSNEFYLFFLYSMDGVKYNVLKYRHFEKSTPTVYCQDLYLSRALQSAKYVSFWFLSKDMYDTRIGDVTWSFREVRNYDGIE